MATDVLPARVLLGTILFITAPAGRESNLKQSCIKGSAMICIGNIKAGFVTHTTFLFGAPDGTTVLTDPYFQRGFEWQGREERHLQLPDIRPASITKCNAIFVSHIHGDHCDFDAIEVIAKANSARILAPREVLAQLGRCGIPDHLFVPLHDGQHVQIGAFDLEALGRYDHSFDSGGEMNKFSLMLKHGQTCLWYAGDCHALPPALNGAALDAVFCWTSPDVIAEIKRMDPRPGLFVIMHHDRHCPGQFWCNRDAAQDAADLARQLPGVEVVVPDRLGSFAAFAR